MSYTLNAQETFTLVATIDVPSEVVFRDLGGEAVILNLTSGQYYGLDEMATHMWRLLSENHSFAEVIDLIIQNYEVEPAQLQRDLFELVSQLQSYGLVRIIQP